VTACVPPVVARLYELPSLPVTVTCVALVAATVNVEEDSALMVVGLATVVTVGTGSTVIVAAALTVTPLLPVATAVYVVVFFGLTACVPPATGRLYVLPSEPVTVTCVALTAVTVSVEAVPDGTVAGFAVSVTAGYGERSLPVKRAHPVRKRRSSPSAPVDETERRNMRADEFIMGLLLFIARRKPDMLGGNVAENRL
jgi:hypothetical protein